MKIAEFDPTVDETERETAVTSRHDTLQHAAPSKEGSAAAHRVWAQNSLAAPIPFANFVISGEATQGRAALMEAIQHKGAEPPRHRHPETDEVFYVINGKMTFTVDGEVIPASAGTTVFIERAKEHTFVVETETAHTLVLLLPAPAETDRQI